MQLLPSAADPWRLLTPINIQTRRLWPWGFSFQKHIDSGEPRPRQSGHLVIASDYGGEHARFTHNVYCFLVVRGGISNWFSAVRSTRQNFLHQGRTMSYKRLDDPQRQKALIPFLKAAANLDGHLVAIAVDRRKRWLSTVPGTTDEIRRAFGLKASWNPRSFEAMMRKVYFVAILLSIWARPMTNVTWITDEDEFVANDIRHDDALLAVARLTACYLAHPMGVFRLNTTGQDLHLTEYEDICSIPDLAAGMLSEVSTRLSKDAVWEDKFKQVLEGPMPLKTDIIADWFWDDQMPLRKTFITVDVEGAKYGIRRVWMTNADMNGHAAGAGNVTATAQGD